MNTIAIGCAGRAFVCLLLVAAMVLGSGGAVRAQVHGAPTTPAAPGRSTVTPPGPGGLPATSSAAANAAAGINPNNQVAPGQPPLNATNSVSSGAENAAGQPLTTAPSGATTPDTTAAAGTSAPTDTSGMTNAAGTSTTAPNTTAPATQPTTTTQMNAVGTPNARSPFVVPAAGQVAPSSAQSQSQSTGR